MMYLKKLGFVLLATSAFSIAFPIMAGMPMTILIITIPMALVWYSVPGAILGATVSISLIFARKWIKPGNLIIILISAVLAPIYSYFWLNILFSGELSRFLSPIPFNPLHSSAQDHMLVQAGIYVAAFFLVSSNFMAGGLCSMFLKGKVVNQLLDNE